MSEGARLVVSPGLEAAAAAAIGSRARVVSVASDPGERLERRWQRLWRERCGARGGLAPGSRRSSMRAVLALLDGEADAALISEADTDWREAWNLPCPRLAPAAAAAAGGVAVPRCADAWIAAIPAAGEGGGPHALGWLEWPAAESISIAVDRLRSAAAALGPALSSAGRAIPAVVDFAGGDRRWQFQLERFRRTLAERGEACAADLYSPLFYAGGRLRALEFVRAVGRALPPERAAVACCPQLGFRELAAGVEAAGGAWSGPFRAAAEHPLARVAADATAAQIDVTCRWLLRF